MWSGRQAWMLYNPSRSSSWGPVRKVGRGSDTRIKTEENNKIKIKEESSWFEFAFALLKLWPSGLVAMLLKMTG